ncbi:hypothetical protein B0J18DRAFT_48844 [Chaetomium sp. MPI-SDFR-AT-0129]|nr:hypothetical protein B0J18DRAFT_48844 [Chaetomium sp. MPI-SDFR-AT-0129]
MVRNPVSLYTSLPKKTRLALGGTLLVWGSLGMAFGDKLEAYLGLTPNEADWEHLDSVMPKIRIMDRDENGGQSGKK